MNVGKLLRSFNTSGTYLLLSTIVLCVLFVYFYIINPIWLYVNNNKKDDHSIIIGVYDNNGCRVLFTENKNIVCF